MTTPIEIEKTLVVNTGHITEQDFDKAKRQAESDQSKGLIIPSLMVENHSFGVIVILGEPESAYAMISDLDTDFSDNFCSCLRLACSLGVNNVRFDEDGTIYDFLPINEW